MDQHAHPEHEGMLRNYTFNDVLMEGHGVYTGVLQALLSVEPGGGASVMSADGAVTDVTFRRVTVRNWVAYDMPAVGFLSTLDRPMTLSIDTFAIENCRGVAGSPAEYNGYVLILGSGLGETDIVYLSVEQSGSHSEDTNALGTVIFQGIGTSTLSPGESHFRFMLSTFIGNRAAVGGALYVTDPLGDVRLCSFIENIAYIKGGAICFEGAREMTIDSSWFFNNAVMPAASSSGLNYALTIFTGGSASVAPIVSCNRSFAAYMYAKPSC